MYKLGKVLLDLPVIRVNCRPICCYKSLYPGMINKFKEPLYLSRVLHHSLFYQNKVPTTLDCHSVHLSKDMSASANEEFRHLDYNQLLESKSAPNNVIIDVREKHELDETGVIPGAHHIPLGDIETAFNTPEDEFKKIYNFDKPSSEDSVIFSCRSGKRSLVALEKALAVGFKNAKHYKGGWLDWEKHLSESKK